jgi:hypothetical protein
VERLRPAWTAWRGHRDADIDVYLTVLSCRLDHAKPHVILIERDGRPDAILVGMTAAATFYQKIGYFTVPTPRVRALRFQYGGFLGNQSKESSKLMINEIEQSLRRGDANVAILTHLREDSPLYHVAITEPRLLARDHFPVKEAHSMMELPQSPEEIYQGFSTKHRRTLRREGKKFLAAFSDDVCIERFNTIDQLDQLIGVVEGIAATTYQRGLGVGFSNSRDIRELLTLEAKKGWLRGFVLHAGGKPCAFLIGCVYKDTFLNEYLGHDPAYSKHSPGMYLLAHVIEELCREGVAKFDFGMGEAFYKQRFGNTQWSEGTVYLYAPTWTGLRVKALRSAAVLINSTGKSLLEKTKLQSRVKRLWRQRRAIQSHERP